ncbi:MAG: hypothetical protein JXR48_17805 [Candidatus Delongbacteria bacterium]|nr:hypothetical protein [Candidatus Delongbacteria bacterium]MBN2836814.1 hypothetical protein [Candidatus Delongbacteria bacterium]
MRKQYHLRPSGNKFNAWDVDRLIEMTKDFDVIEVDVLELLERNKFHWYQGDNLPTVKSIFDHMKLVEECSLDYPIILSTEGIIMDGMHRVGKAYLQNIQTIKAVKFDYTPKPDFVNVLPDELSYDR